LSLAAAISAGTVISEPADRLDLPYGMPRNDSMRLYLPTPDAVYVLKCSNGKYYVGRTLATCLEQRLSEHASGKGCYWTKLHPPLEVVEIVSPAYPYAEEAVTLRYMEAFGMNDVRGGSKARAFLNKADVVTVTRSLRNEKNLCMECGSPDHWVDDCPSLDGGTKGGRTVSDDGKEKEKESDDNAERKDSGLANAKKTAKPQAKKNAASAGSSEEAAPASWTTRNGKYCTRCGRNSHWESECFAKNHIDGTPLTRSYFSYKKPTRGGKRW
jgi:predicted GIY-YIG superfamily endonuclease